MTIDRKYYYLNEKIELGKNKIEGKKGDLSLIDGKEIRKYAEKYIGKSDSRAPIDGILLNLMSYSEQIMRDLGSDSGNITNVSVKGVYMTKSEIPYLKTYIQRRGCMEKLAYWYFDPDNKLRLYTPLKGNLTYPLGISFRNTANIYRDLVKDLNTFKKQFPDDVFIASIEVGYDDLRSIFAINENYCDEDFEAAIVPGEPKKAEKQGAVKEENPENNNAKNNIDAKIKVTSFNTTTSTYMPVEERIRNFENFRVGQEFEALGDDWFLRPENPNDLAGRRGDNN